MGETTIEIDTSTDYGEEVKKVMIDESDGIIDCWFAQDNALERASTAREAVSIMGDLVETYGWHTQWGECMDITDGDEVWIMEIYGRDIWVAFKLPDDRVFVSANRARIRDVDLDDEENVMYSPNLVSFAVEQGWYDPDSGKPFRPADVYCSSDSIYCARREWRAFDLMAPSLNLSPHELKYPQSVKPDDLLSVHGIFKIKGDYYQGTEYDLTKGPAAGPWGDPIRGSGFERSIGMHRTCYVHIAEVKGWLPDPVKGISWYGYGHPASTYLTPLWPIMRELPEFYRTGSRYEGFRRDSGWWINTYTQRMTELCWEKAIQDIQAFRNPRMETVYEDAAEVQEQAARLLEKHPNDQKAVNIISEFAYNTAVTWHEDWEKLGDELLSKYWTIQATSASKLPEWWLEVIDYEPPVP
jgi:dipeptidase